MYRLDTDGVATEVHADIFPDSDVSGFSASDYTVNTKTGKIYFLEAPSGDPIRRVRVWDINEAKFEGYTNIQGLPSGGNPLFIEYPTNLNEIVKKTCVSTSDSCANNDTTKVTFGADGENSIAVIDDEGLSVGGKSIVRREVNAAGEEELHIGENSLVTVESVGIQKLYATDSTGNKVPINVSEGSDLQINGVSVQGQIDARKAETTTNAAGITTNATNISTNTANISTAAAGITTNAAGITTNAAGITTNAANISTNTANISTNTANISANKEDIRVNATDIKANTKRIDINAKDINANTKSIEINTSNINSNAKAINTNSKGISINAEGISRNSLAVQGNRNDINKLQTDVKSLGSGIAGATALSAALSSLPTTSDDSPFSCGVGSGGYSSRYAMGVGCSARLNERLSFNAGGSVLFGGASTYGSSTLDTMAGRAGFVFKLGKITPTNEKANEQLQSKLNEVETQNEQLVHQLAGLTERLNQLEALALGTSKNDSIAITRK